MFRTLTINKYISKNFLIIITIMTLGFFSLSTIMNLFEEINFFKDIDIGILLPFFMSMIIAPNVIYNLLPFIVFLSSMWLFLKLIKTDEVIAMKTSGFSNVSIIIVPCLVAFLLGIFSVIAINPITSVLVEKYENIKGSYNTDNEYLAAITSNGIWIKEKNEGIISIIRSNRLENNYLIDVSLYQFDKNYNPISRIEAESANIKNLSWILNDVKVFNKDDNTATKIIDSLSYRSVYDITKIKSLYSNLDTISFWNIKNQIELLQDRGYSTKEMHGKFQKSVSFPFFLVSMVLLAGVFTMGNQYKKNNWSYIFISILACVFIYFCNDFSLALGKTDTLPIAVSVWMPVIIIFIFSTVGLIHVNEK